MNREKHKGPDFRIILEVTEPVKNENGWDITAIATVLYHRQYAPDPPKEVIFSLDGVEIDRISTDSESGQATATINLSTAKNYHISTFLSDFPGIRSSKRIAVKKEEKKNIPANLFIDKIGNCGKYTLVFQVLTADNKPVAKADVRIIDSRAKIINLKTGDFGIARYNVRFKERRRILTAMVLSGNVPLKQIYLFGPPQH